jgi:hypothetical protein
MPTRPQKVTMDTNVMNILNAIRNNASNNYRDYVPAITDTSQLREIGTIIMDYPALQNEFLSALINRIGRVLISTKMYENPWTRFKKGMLDYGETVEEIFTNIAKPYEFEGSHTTPTSQFKKYKPDVRSAFHVMNYRKYYPVTIEQQKLRQAFLSAEGVTNLIGDIVNSLYTGANYDEWLTMKYLLAKTILKGRMYPVETMPISADNAKAIVTTVKENSNILEFPSTKYNPAHVFQHTKKSEQVIFINARFDAIMDVNVLASAFNMDKAQFMGQRVLIDSFGSLDRDRLDELFADDPNYVPITDEEVEALDTIPMAVVDEKFFMIFDNLNEFTEIYNAELLYWNYFYHQWKTFSTSPFSNALVYVPATPSVTSVEVTPATATVSAGSSLALTVTVETEGFAPQTVDYESDTEGVTITEGGVVQVDAGVSGTATITVTSTFDPTVSDTVTLTIS